ncbi:MAG: hypothetical protein WA902_14130 [Thermosynechococcaceae cyanobacterium]
MTLSNNPESFEAQVLKRLESFEGRFDKIDTDIKTTNERISTYWEASKLLVNLAFGLIATAVLAILVRAAVGG